MLENERMLGFENGGKAVGIWQWAEGSRQ